MLFNTLVEAAAYWAEMMPDKICLIESESGKSITYHAFWQSSLVFAQRLKASAELKKGDRVVVRVGPLIETLVAQFGVYLAGGVYCPVEKRMKPIKIEELSAHFDSKLLISTERADCGCHNWIDLASVLDGGPVLEEVVFPNPEDMCAIIFTTGTTGKAKGVMISYKMPAFVGKTWPKIYDYELNDVFLWTQPLDRVGGVMFFGAAFFVGATAVHHNGIVFIKDYFKKLREYRVTVMYLQSFTAAILLEADPDSFTGFTDQIRLMAFGGGKMPESHRRQMRLLLPKTRFFMQYGATEGWPVTYYEFSNIHGKLNCVGKPTPGTQISFIDDNGVPFPATAENPGTVVCKNQEMVMMGYWKSPELTARALKDGMLITTDIGYADDEGYLCLLGRKDDVIVSGGFKIAPYEIEEVVMQIPDVLECVCVPAVNKVLGSVPRVFAVMKPGFEFSAKIIMNYLAERLETFKLPRIITQLDALPRVRNSEKIDRKVLREYE